MYQKIVLQQQCAFSEGFYQMCSQIKRQKEKWYFFLEAFLYISLLFMPII